MDIYFFCGSCGQHMVIDDAGAGLVIQCPRCRGEVTVPGAIEPKPAPSPQPDGTPRAEKDKTVALKWVPPAAHPRKNGNG
jgi:DNA-directed RNA polymerase subunit RPC12/RpoP